MTREQRRALLGDTVIEQIRADVEAAPAPPADVLDLLRPIFARPHRTPAAPSHEAAEAA
ncbi:hypothetical protein [Streptomyces sp. B15]|uniref:hypothetical protein n=1 Tax=Streptomyces sp. B15 TaxID=1537797 RepID=UPI001B3658BB|nr:hypothetical protein [Streptomyces sp. B15]MBQ1122586.1 hypothetical protein [Streptomyces sp. B15]